MTGLDGVPANAVDVMVDVTASGGSTAGSYTTNCTSSACSAFAVTGGYWAKGQQVTDLAMVSTSGGRAVIENAGAGTASFSVSVVGYDLYIGSNAVFLPATPKRLDTVTIGARSSVPLAIAGRNGVPATGTTAVAVNLTASRAIAGGSLVAYADGTNWPPQMNLSYAADATIANAAIVMVGKDGAIRLFNAGSKPVTVNVDLTGSYYAYP